MPRNSPAAVGALLIVVSAITYGVQPALGKLAYADGIAPSTITFGRFALAVALLELHYLFLPKGGRVGARELAVTTAVGLVFAGATVCYYLSLQYLSPVVFSFAYYTYPLLTLFAGALLFAEKITARHLAATLGLAGGAALLLGGGEVAADAAGVLWILGCAACMALFFQLQRFLPKRRCELYHARIMFRVLAAVFLLWWLANGAPDAALDNRGLAWVALIGVVSTYIAFIAAIMGIARLGPAHAALLSGQEPLWTALFSFALLGVALGPAQWVGAGVMLAAVFWVNAAALKAAPRQARRALTR